MQFLSPWMLWGMAALAAPIAIHFWQRRKVVRLAFSTLKYLRVIAARTSRSAKLENLLLLLLRCALFALVVLAASRPAVSKHALRALGGNVQRTVVLVLDDSMSMGYRDGDRTRLDAAREQAFNVLDSLKDGDEVAVVAADDRARDLVAQPTLDRSVAHHAIEGVQPTQAGTDFSPALIAARKILAASTKAEREVYLFTDNQQGGWRFDPKTVFDDAWKKSEITLNVIEPDTNAALNAAVTQVKITSPLARPGTLVSGVATVANFSRAPLHDLLKVRVADAEVASLAVEAGPEASVDFPFDFQMPAAGSGVRTVRGVARLQGDSLTADDQYFFTVPIHRAPKVVIFEGQSTGPERIHSGFFLGRALAAGEAGTPPLTLPASAIQEASLGSYSAVFLADVPRLSDREVIKLDTYAKAGGTVVLFPGDSTDLAALARMDFLPATPIRLRELPIGRLSSQIIDPDHPLFANTWGPATPFPPLPQKKLIEWKGKPDLKVLVLAGGSEGFVMTSDDGAGKVFIVNASPDRAWGDFPLSPAFLPLVQQMALQSSENGLASRGFTVGEPVPTSPALPRDQPLTVTLPDDTTQSVLLGDKTTLLDRAAANGFYQVSAPNDPALLVFAVNVDARESDLAPITEEALTAITPHNSVAGVDNLRQWLAQSRGMVPLWPWLVLLLALVFAAEGAVSNLAARNRSQGDETHIKTGRLNKRRVGSPFRAAAPEEVGV